MYIAKRFLGIKVYIAAVSRAFPQYMRCKYNFNHGTMHELYDLEADPDDYVNLIDDPGMKDVADDLRDQLIAWYDPENNPYQSRRVFS
jgi:hypothetical protein